MRITLLHSILIGLTLSLGYAHDAHTQGLLDRAVSVKFKNTELRKVLSKIEAEAEVKFVYSSTVIQPDRKVSVSVENRKLSEVLKEVLEPLDISYRVIGGQIMLTSLGVKRQASLPLPENAPEVPVERTIAGTVTDEKGEGLPGVNVLLKGTQRGTTADAAGKFSLSVPDGAATLVFSFVGYAPKEVEVAANQTVLDVTLAVDNKSLNEVVVVGYGSQQKVNLTGAISTIKFDDEINNRPITNSSQALGGTASGVWVSQNSGKPGSDGAQIRVRGWGTLNNSNPLIIIDGVEGTFEQLNPSDIESISVLKDAASAAIFGSKAANGVVLVTTRMGKTNEKMQVNVNSYVGVQTLGMHPDVINNSAEHMELTNRGLISDGGSQLFSNDLISAFRNGSDPYKYPNTDWFKELYKSAPIHEHNVSVRGGTAQTSSYISFNYLSQDGIVPNTQSRRYGIRANLESNVNRWLKIGGRLSYLNRDSQEPYADIVYGSLGRVFEMLSGAAPYIAPYTRDGQFGSVQAIAADGNLLYDNRNPLIDAANGRTITEDNVFTVNTTANIKFSESLSLRTTFATNGNFTLADRYNTSVFGYTDTGIETITKNYNREGLEINRGQTSTLNTNLFSTLNFNHTFNEVHAVSAIAGMQLESNKIQTLYARRTMPPKEGLTQVDAGTSGIQGEGNLNRLRIFSYFGRLNYAFDQKYLFEANLRADASSRFKEGNRLGVFPGFSAGWRISDEAFMEDIRAVSNLKLRASWGKLGNQNIANYWPYLTIITQDNSLSYNYGGKFAPGAAITSLVDDNITWETTATLDIGLELGLFNDKITIEADYFRKTTDNIIVQLPIPSLLGGLTPPFENKGQMSNNGFEFIFNYNNQNSDRDRLGFNMGLNFTYINNEVTEFAGGRSPDQLYLIREGYSYRELYGFNAIGIYQTDEEAKEHMFANGFKPRAGNLKFEDVNNDGKLGFEDRKALGNTIPKLTFGASPSFKYKRFELNVLLQGILGVNMYTRNNFTSLSFENRVISTSWRDAWTPENPNTDIPALRFNNTWDDSPSSFWVNKADFVKVKNIQLGYTLPESLSTKIGLKRTYFYLNAQNVLTLVNGKYQGYDPEKNTFDNGARTYPVPAIVSVGLNLNI